MNHSYCCYLCQSRVRKPSDPEGYEPWSERFRSVSPVCLSSDVLVSHLSSRNLARSASPPGLFSGRGSRNFRNILCAREVSSLKSLGRLTGIRTPVLPCQCRYRTYRGSSLPAFCQGRQPVRHTNITIPNCHTSCDVSALQQESCTSVVVNLVYAYPRRYAKSS
jgi:hypothetical protein